MLGRVLKFAILGGVLGEALEILRLTTGGMAPPDWRLRLTLLAAYGVVAGVVFAFAVWMRRRRRGAAAVAVALFGAFVLLPWLNFDYLPQVGSWQTWVGSGLAVLALALAAPWVARFGRVSAAAVLVFAVAVNGAGLLGGRAGGANRGPAAGKAAPALNVMVVLIDTLRADHLGAYGYGRDTSPNFDRLAKEGVLFEHAVSQACWTKPSVSSLFTGTYVHHHGVISSRDALGPELPTLAEKMRAQGFHTAGFSANPWITPEFHFDRGFDEFVSQHAMGVQLTNLYRVIQRGQRLLRRVGVRADVAGLVFQGSAEENPSNSRRDEILTEEVIRWLRENGGRPFFAYVHLIGPHDPYDPPATFARRFRDPAWDGGRSPTKPPARVQSIFEKAAPLDDVTRARLIAQYDGAIAFSDQLLGRIAGELERLHLLDRTLLVVTADHGEEFYEHHNWRHGNQLYDEVIHVPLIFHLPGRLAPQRRRDPAMLIDIFPTLFGVLGLPLDLPHPDGRDLFGPIDPMAPVYSEYFRFDGGTYVSRAVLRDHFKLKETRDAALDRESTELYDLASDPGEKKNLLGNQLGVNDNGTKVLKALLADFGRDMPVSSAPGVDVDRSTRERLRQLGY